MEFDVKFKIKRSDILIYQIPKIDYVWPLLVSVSHSDKAKEMMSK